jgi:tetratricopeptide (TPR) repeat protein
MHILFSVFLLLILSTGIWTSSRAEVKLPAGTASNKVTADLAGDADETRSVTFESLAQMNELVKLGMPALALSLLDDAQQKRQQFTAEWYAFEYKRILLLSSLERWEQLLSRTQWLFDTAQRDKHITRKIRYWFETQQVIARLQLKQSEQALDQLQTLIWTSEPENRDSSLLPVWRRLVIRAYLQIQRDDDARRALIKYEYDYGTDSTDVDWVLLQAQVLLRTDRPQQAMRILKQISAEDAVDVEALLLIARLQSDPASAKEIYRQMREQLDGQVLNKSSRWAKSYVAYLAAKSLGDTGAQISSLETMLSLKMDYPVFDESFQVTADDLWELYNNQGRVIANDYGLLFGDDEQWQQLSNQLVQTNPEKALQLNAALVLHTDNFSTRQHQHKTIVEIIEKRKNGLELIDQLYLHSNKVTDVNVLPDEVRYRLVDYALSESDYYAASTIMKTLKQPPEGKSLFDWRMRTARVLILQGEYAESEKMIRKTFSEKPKITHDELDRYIQVVFDFQTVQQHEQAIKLFDLLYIDGLDEKLKREIYFWKAESYFSLEQYDNAALFYLQSASAVKDGGNDLWAQSARFKAGRALILAGIYFDAEKVFTELLLITDSDARKALINQNLQKIRLLKSTTKKTKS